jgi:hypothetical protein
MPLIADDRADQRSACSHASGHSQCDESSERWQAPVIAVRAVGKITPSSSICDSRHVSRPREVIFHPGTRCSPDLFPVDQPQLAGGKSARGGVEDGKEGQHPIRRLISSNSRIGNRPIHAACASRSIVRVSGVQRRLNLVLQDPALHERHRKLAVIVEHVIVAQAASYRVDERARTRTVLRDVAQHVALIL